MSELDTKKIEEKSSVNENNQNIFKKIPIIAYIFPPLGILMLINFFIIQNKKRDKNPGFLKRK